MEDVTLRVSELFYSLQGEGKRAGDPSVFIRLQGCSAKHACATSGVVCDTEFESGRVMTLSAIKAWMQAHAPGCEWIVWTGGEPTDHLTDAIVAWFSAFGYQQAIETSGVRPVPQGLAWVTLSPKVAEHILVKHFPQGVSEIKYVRHVGQDIPKPSVQAAHRLLSPHSDGFTINGENLAHCIALCKAHPEWSLSVQQHKLWRVL